MNYLFINFFYIKAITATLITLYYISTKNNNINNNNNNIRYNTKNDEMYMCVCVYVCVFVMNILTSYD